MCFFFMCSKTHSLAIFLMVWIKKMTEKRFEEETGKKKNLNAQYARLTNRVCHTLPAAAVIGTVTLTNWCFCSLQDVCVSHRKRCHHWSVCCTTPLSGPLLLSVEVGCIWMFYLVYLCHIADAVDGVLCSAGLQVPATPVKMHLNSGVFSRHALCDLHGGWQVNLDWLGGVKKKKS